MSDAPHRLRKRKWAGTQTTLGFLSASWIRHEAARLSEPDRDINTQSQRPHPMLKGSCLCGAVSWTFDGMPDSATACNCTACRRYGTLWAYDYEDERINPAKRRPTSSARR